MKYFKSISHHEFKSEEEQVSFNRDIFLSSVDEKDINLSKSLLRAVDGCVFFTSNLQTGASQLTKFKGKHSVYKEERRSRRINLNSNNTTWSELKDVSPGHITTLKLVNDVIVDNLEYKALCSKSRNCASPDEKFKKNIKIKLSKLFKKLKDELSLEEIRIIWRHRFSF